MQVLTYTHVLLQNISLSTFIAHVWTIAIAAITGFVTLWKDNNAGDESGREKESEKEREKKKLLCFKKVRMIVYSSETLYFYL